MKKDLVWTIPSALFIAICNVLINVLIGVYFDPKAVGIFNQASAIYIPYSYICNFGIHLAVLYKTSLLSAHKEIGMVGSVLWASFLCIVGIAIPFIILSYFLISFIDQIFSAGGTLKQAWVWIIPALLFYPLNRTLLNALNGLSHFRSFAFFLAFRHVLFIFTLLVLIELQVATPYLTLVFAISEFLLFLFLLACLVGFIKQRIVSNELLSCAKELCIFGTKAWAGTLATEFNARIDILCLSYLTNPETVGLYSLASLIFEGVSQLLIAIRNTISPKVTYKFTHESVQSIKAFLQELILKTTLGTLTVSSVLICLYPYLVYDVMKNLSYTDGYFPLIILLSGITLVSGFFVIDTIFIQAGIPSLHSYFKISVFVFNMIMNMLLIPRFSLIGAALANFSTLSFAAIFLVRFCSTHLGFQLLKLD